MPLTLFDRCEVDTLDATHDFTAGDNTATNNSGAILDAAANLGIGTLGLSIPTTADNRRFSPTSIIDRLEGCMGFLFRWPSTIGGTGAALAYARGVSTNNAIELTVAASQELQLNMRDTVAGVQNIVTTAANLAGATTYGTVIRWNNSLPHRSIEVYDSGGTLIHSVVDTNAYTAPTELDGTNGLQFGDFSGSGFQALYMKNLMVASNYDEPLEDNLFITSYTEYGGGGPVVVPKLHLVRSNIRMN